MDINLAETAVVGVIFLAIAVLLLVYYSRKIQNTKKGSHENISKTENASVIVVVGSGK